MLLKAGILNLLIIILSPTAYALTLADPQIIELPIVATTLTGAGGTTLTIPGNATAVFLNVTAVSPQEDGYITVWPCGVDRPVASNVNYRAGDVVPNGVIASIGRNGAVCFYSQVATELVVDIAGWFEGADYVGATPQRLADTRNGINGNVPAKVAPATPLRLQVTSITAKTATGTDTVIPASSRAVSLNLTVVSPATGGYLTVWPCDVDKPLASNVNFSAGQVVANGVVAPVSATGEVCVFASTETDLVVDLAGWFAGSVFTGAVPKRFVDTRDGTGTLTPGQLLPGNPLAITIRGAQLEINGSRQAIPDSATAVALNVTMVSPTGSGYATIWPCSSNQPEASNLNFVAGQVVANNVIAPIGDNGQVCVYASVATDVVVDVSGYFGSDFIGTTPKRLQDTRAGIGQEPKAVANFSQTRTGSWISSGGTESLDGNIPFSLQLASAADVTLELSSSNIDTVLYLLNEANETIKVNDDDGTSANSRISTTLEPGNYTLLAATYSIGETGDFSLTVSGSQGAIVFEPQETIFSSGAYISMPGSTLTIDSVNWSVPTKTAGVLVRFTDEDGTATEMPGQLLETAVSTNLPVAQRVEAGLATTSTMAVDFVLLLDDGSEAIVDTGLSAGITALPLLPLAPGTIAALFMQARIETLDITLEKWRVIAMATNQEATALTIIDTLTRDRANLVAALADIDTIRNGTATSVDLGTLNNVGITLDSDALAKMDQLLASYMLSDTSLQALLALTPSAGRRAALNDSIDSLLATFKTDFIDTLLPQSAEEARKAAQNIRKLALGAGAVVLLTTTAPVTAVAATVAAIFLATTAAPAAIAAAFETGAIEINDSEVGLNSFQSTIGVITDSVADAVGRRSNIIAGFLTGVLGDRLTQNNTDANTIDIALDDTAAVENLWQAGTEGLNPEPVIPADPVVPKDPVVPTDPEPADPVVPTDPVPTDPVIPTDPALFNCVTLTPDQTSGNEGCYNSDSRKEGLWTYYYSNGDFVKTTWKNGVREGLYTSYEGPGSSGQAGNYVNGQKDGLWTFYYSNGEFEKTTWKNGVRDGPYTSYEGPGSTGYVGNYVNGQKSGLWIFYYSNGETDTTQY